MFQLALDILIPAVVIFIFLRWVFWPKRKEGEPEARQETDKKEE